MGREHLGQPCQKQPSTKTTTLAFGNAKSGLPGSGKWRRHPVIRAARKIATMRCSVLAFPVERTRAMIRERSGVVGHGLVAAIAGARVNHAVLIFKLGSVSHSSTISL